MGFNLQQRIIRNPELARALEAKPIDYSAPPHNSTLDILTILEDVLVGMYYIPTV